jgi:aryl-alcohol dehydrogenase-like predicted oxidoreductase
MQYTTLGKTGLVVSRLLLGTANFGTGISHGIDHPVDQEMATRLVSQAIEDGINVFDTSNVYGLGLAEEFLGRALGSRRKEVIIATKIGRRTSNALIDVGLSFRNVIISTEASLKRLGTDYIDLLQLHVSDPVTPFEETARALEYLVQHGLVRYVGYSNFSGWQADRFLAIQQQHHYASFVSGQMSYSLLSRGIEHEIVPFSQHTGLGLLTYSPLAGGLLSGKYTRENPTGNVDGRDGRLASFAMLSADRETSNPIVEKLHIIAAHHEVTPSQIALAWVLAKPFVTSVILGARNLQQFSANVKASDLYLSQEEVKELDTITELEPLYPYTLKKNSRDLAVEQALRR